MELRDGTCPKCGNTWNNRKEKLMGADTMDIICGTCKYTGHWKEFHPEGDKERKAQREQQSG